ncbi:MAG: dephospho-CoA kinase [Clostridiales Family XIII bacterium]|jgi:dephospho-CoA kinase|nr:dephospho-CoA kinase [Clostridiales Family XIII bacterium]
MNSNSGFSAEGKRMRVIGITGGIGSGKSVVTAYLRRRLYSVHDADEIAAEAVRPGEPALNALTEAFGKGILCDDGTLDRRALADLAFGNGENVKILNRIMHADIERRIAARLERHRSHILNNPGERETPKPVFLAAPLLFEAGLSARCDEVWLIAADEALRVRRAAERDGVGEERIRARVLHQMPEAEKRAKADIVIENNGSVDALLARVDRLIDRRCADTGTPADTRESADECFSPAVAPPEL